MTLADETIAVASAETSGRYAAMSPYGVLGAVGWTLLALLIGGIAMVVALIISFFALYPEAVSNGVDGFRSLPQLDQMVLSLYGMLALQVSIFFVALLAASRRGYRASDVLALRAPRSFWPFVWGPLLVIVTALAVGNILNLLMPFDSMQDMEMWMPLIRSEHWWLVFVVAALGAPLSEEIWFRGFVLPSLARTFAGVGPGRVDGRPAITATGVILAAALASAVLFSLAHVYHLPGAITVLSLGLVLSFVLWRTGSLWVSMVSHGVYNLAVFSFVKWGMPMVEAAGQAT